MRFSSIFKIFFASSLIIAPLSLSATARPDNQQDRSFLFFGKKKKKATSSSEDAAGSSSSPSAYEELVNDSSKIDQGMFNVIAKGEDYYFEIPDSLLGRDMLVVNKMVRVPEELNEAGVNRGINYNNQMVRFEYDPKADKVFVRQSRPLPLVPEDASIALSVADNYISPIIASFKVEAHNPDSTALVIKVNDIYNGNSTAFNNVFNDINLGTSVNSDLSRIIRIKSFDNNIHAIAELTTKVVEPSGTVYVTVEIGSSLLLLPEKPMTRRYASPRVGYFSDPVLRFSDDQQRVKKSHFINRWRLEPKPGEEADYLAGRLVEPAQPIVFYIDPSTPDRWRPYIKEGVEAWQKAFEMAGFKNAIVARDIPEDEEIDRDDMSYSVINYAASSRANAMGPSITDPRSGEILEADIMWWHNVIEMVHDWIIVQTGAVNPAVRKPQLPDSIMGDAMRFVACHEVGHSLGLRHNMTASSAIPVDSLRSKSYTDMLGGTSSSIMDYARFNYVAQPGDNVTVMSPNIGPYDLLAIEYGYRWFGKDNPEDEVADLQELLSNYTGNLYIYSEAQDMREGIDPRAQSEDLGDNSMKASRYGIANLKRIVPEIVKWTTTGELGQDYDAASRLFAAVLSQWSNYVYHVLTNVGGIYVDNTTVGDGRPTYRFVEKDRQRDAVQFLIDEVFTTPEWIVDADLTNYTYVILNSPVGRIEQVPSFMLTNMQSYIFWDLLTDNRLIRMLENESRSGKDAFTAIEMMDMLHNAIFKTTLKGGNPDVRERRVQKNYVDALITAACERQGVKSDILLADRSLDPRVAFSDHGAFCSHDECNRGLGDRPAASRVLNMYGTQANRVSDVVSVKRGELMRIRQLMINNRNAGDRAVRYHYNDMLMRINSALGLPQQ